MAGSERLPGELDRLMLNKEASNLFNELIIRLEKNQRFADALRAKFFDEPESIATHSNPLIFKAHSGNPNYEFSIIRTEEEDELCLFKPGGEDGELIQIRLLYDLVGFHRRLKNSFLIYDRVKDREFCSPTLHEVNTFAADRLVRGFIARF